MWSISIDATEYYWLVGRNRQRLPQTRSQLLACTHDSFEPARVVAQTASHRAKSSPRVTVEASDVFRVRGLADGSITVDGNRVTLEEITPLLRSRNAERRARGEAELIAVVETHPDASYQTMVSILDQVRAADSRRVALQILEDEP